MQQQELRTVGSSHPYWLSMSFGLTGSGVTEAKSDITAETQEDINILGGTTDLTGAEIQLGTLTGGPSSLGISGPYRSVDRFPVLSAFGKYNSGRPYIWNEAPYRLETGATLRGVVTNSGVETGGHVVMIGQPRKPATAVNMPAEGNMFFLKVDANFTGSAAQEKSNPTKKLDFDVLVVGAFCDFAQLDTSVRITDAEGDIWCPPDTYVPGWAVAGRASSQLPVMRWGGLRYRLPAKSVLRVAFKNSTTTPETNRAIWFACYQLTQEGR